MSQQRSITDVDLRSRDNNSAHHTWEIDLDRLIVRRGQPFSITLQYCGCLPCGYHLELVLYLGKRDEVAIKVQKERGAGDKWWFKQQLVQGEILLTLNSPADAIIGEYRLTVQMMSPDGRVFEKLDKIGFHLLFNPWCRDDVVYLNDDLRLKEYIMNEDGLIYTGSCNNICHRRWNYGQFEDNVMDICFQILDNSKDALKNLKMDIERRSDPVYISRMISAMVNCNGDKGVLSGRWCEPYCGGVAPYRWTGSVPILRQWSKSGCRPVNYGQCWVFAAVACTVLRCLGIPTRVITNFCSAHDVDGNLSVDFLYNDKMQSSGKTEDSNWNFHCWVESWMRRDDLPKGNGGWQVIDPTPQELSDGEYCCGPCPVKAIKEGNLGVKYDARFIFAEVNADIVHWMVQRDGKRQKIRVDQSSVGKYISTKSVYGNVRKDVTLHYKYPEGSKKEREVYEKAGRPIGQTSGPCTEPGRLLLGITKLKPVFGTDFDVIIEVKNEGGKDVCAQLTVMAMAVTYNCINRGEFCRQTASLTLTPQKGHKEVLRLKYEDYAKVISEHHLIKVKAFLQGEGTKQPIMTVVDIPLTTPELQIEVPGKVVRWERTTAYISFTNPLPVVLRGGVFTVEGCGLLCATEVHVHGDICPGQKVSAQVCFSPRRVGFRKLLVDFDSDKLKDVKGDATVNVCKKFRQCSLFSKYF